MPATSTHFKVPITMLDRTACLGADGSAAMVNAVIRMMAGRWKLPILFRLFERSNVRTLELRRDLPGISQKMLTQHLRELEVDGLIERFDPGEKPRRVEYMLSPTGVRLLPVLRSIRAFAESHPGMDFSGQSGGSATD